MTTLHNNNTQHKAVDSAFDDTISNSDSVAKRGLRSRGSHFDIPGLKDVIQRGDFSAIAKHRQYMSIRERVYDVNLITTNMNVYEPLMDEFLEQYFKTARMQKHLKKLGLIDENGNIVDQKSFKQHMVAIENQMKERAIHEQKERAEINRGIELAIRREIDVSKGQQIRPSKLKAHVRQDQERAQREIHSAYPKGMAKTAEVYLHNGPQNKSMLNMQAKSKTSLPTISVRPQTTANTSKPPAKTHEKTRPSTTIPKKSTISPKRELQKQSKHEAVEIASVIIHANVEQATNVQAQAQPPRVASVEKVQPVAEERQPSEQTQIEQQEKKALSSEQVSGSQKKLSGSQPLNKGSQKLAGSQKLSGSQNALKGSQPKVSPLSQEQVASESATA